jgi:hypothetical protein
MRAVTVITKQSNSEEFDVDARAERASSVAGFT